MQLTENQKKEVVNYYLDPKNPLAYGSVSQFRHFLKTDLGVEVDLVQLRDLLREFVPSLTIDKESQLKFPRRVLLAPCIDYSWSAGLSFLSL